MDKRAIELQFHWIFILIAGALILAFFFSVVQKQRALSEEKLAVTLSAQMDAIFAGAIESKGTTQRLVTPQPGIAFACSQVCECNFVIGDKATEFRDKILFAPALIADQDAIAWAVDWKAPFRVANFLMLTNPGIKYYLIYDNANPRSSQLHDKVRKALPKELNAESLPSPDRVLAVSPEGDAQTRFVFIGTAKPDLRQLGAEFADEDVSGIWIDDDASRVVFYEMAGFGELDFNELPSALAGDATLYGAIFAGDRRMYDCMAKRGFEKLAIVADVQAKRAAALQSSLARPECPYITQTLDMVARAATALSGAPSLDTEEAAVALQTVLQAQSELKRQNDNLILQSCPELY
jgi:hypothetical protein